MFRDRIYNLLSLIVLGNQVRQHGCQQVADINEAPSVPCSAWTPPRSGSMSPIDRTSEVTLNPVDHLSIGVCDGDDRSERYSLVTLCTNMALSVNQACHIAQYCGVRWDRQTPRPKASFDSTHGVAMSGSKNGRCRDAKFLCEHRYSLTRLIPRKKSLFFFWRQLRPSRPCSNNPDWPDRNAVRNEDSADCGIADAIETGDPFNSRVLGISFNDVLMAFVKSVVGHSNIIMWEPLTVQ